MTAQTQTPALPAWEARFFAGIIMESAESRAVEAKRKHEVDAASYIASVVTGDRTKVIIARTNLSHSLKRLHFVQKNLNTAKVDCSLTNLVTIAQ